MAVLLTGPPGVGKTTIIQGVATALVHRDIRGFVTREMRRGGQRVGFELCSFGGRKETLAHVGIRARHRVGRYGVDIAALDEIVALELERVLELADDAGIYLVDEIGKMECYSSRFRAAVRTLLDSGRPVVATVALRGGGFIQEVKDRADVEIWDVTTQNRSELPRRIADWVEVPRR